MRTVGVGLALDDERDALEDAGLADDLGAHLGDPTLVDGSEDRRGTAGDRLGQRELADVVHERGVLEVDAGRARLTPISRPTATARRETRREWPVSV